MKGGTTYLDFNPPAEYVYDMGFLDNDYGGKLTVEYGNGKTAYFTLPGTSVRETRVFSL